MNVRFNRDCRIIEVLCCFYNTLLKLLSEFNSFLSILLSGLNDIDWYIKLYFKTKKHSKNMHL